MGKDGSLAARELYSSLYFHLEARGLTVGDLARRVAALGETVGTRTLQRLADPERPLKHIDTRVLEAIWRALGTEIGALLVFAPLLAPDLRRLPAVEHIILLGHGGTDDAANLALGCGACNLAKGTRIGVSDLLSSFR